MWELLGLEIDVGTVPRPPVSRALSGIKVVRAYRSQAQARTSRCTYTGKNICKQLNSSQNSGFKKIKLNLVKYLIWFYNL